MGGLTDVTLLLPLPVVGSPLGTTLGHFTADSRDIYEAALTLLDEGRSVSPLPVRLIGEQHVIEDLGRVPSFADWAREIRPASWMLRANPQGSPGLDPDIITATVKGEPDADRL